MRSTTAGNQTTPQLCKPHTVLPTFVYIHYFYFPFNCICICNIRTYIPGTICLLIWHSRSNEERCRYTFALAVALLVLLTYIHTYIHAYITLHYALIIVLYCITCHCGGRSQHVRVCKERRAHPACARVAGAHPAQRTDASPPRTNLS